MTPVLLAGLAAALAWPLPALLARLPRLRRTPGPALLLWQSVAAAAVLGALGAGLSLVTDRAWRESPGPWSYAVAAAAVLVTGVVAARLLLSAHRVGTELRTIRRRHREQVDLVGRRVSDGGVRVLDHPLPVAYCLPGMGGSRIVMSSGALGRLEPDQLRAVLIHERAHLRARHDLVLEAFGVLHRAFPRLRSSGLALGEVGLLVEALADRAAARAGLARPLASALQAMAEGRLPAGTLGAGGTGLAARVVLLAEARPRPVQAATLVAASAAVLLLPTMFVVEPWLAGLG